MIPIPFDEANATFRGNPEDFAPSQVGDVRCYQGIAEAGAFDGARVVVVCWQPSPDDIELMKAGNPIYLSCIGGLAPHFLTMSFEEASKPK